MSALVLIPGMMCDARLYAPQIASLSASHSVHVAEISSSDNVQQLAANVLAQAPQQFALAGLSMGGIVAMEMMAQAPDRISHLALLDTNPLAEKEDVATMREGQMDRVKAGALKQVMRDELKPLYLYEGPHKNQILDLCLDMALGLGVQVFIRQSRALQTRPDQSQVLQRVTVPTLILTGEEDRLCPIQCHQLMHQLIPHSQLQVINRAGHLPTLEQAESTTAALQDWLQA